MVCDNYEGFSNSIEQLSKISSTKLLKLDSGKPQLQNTNNLMQIRSISLPQDRAAILEHIRAVHGSGDAELMEHWYNNAPSFDPDDGFVIEGEQGEIVSYAMLIPRAIQFGDSVLPAAQISTLGTLDAYRGQGFASALVDMSIRRMEERNDALGLVVGIPNFYERWGFEYGIGLYLTSYESCIDTETALRAGMWDLQHSHQRRVSSRLGIQGKSILVREFNMDDLPAVNALYTQSSAQGHSVIARDYDTWRAQLDYLVDIGRNERDNFLVAEHKGNLLAYIRTVSNGPVNWFREDAAEFSIIEFAGDDPDGTEALLAEAAASAQAFSAPRIGLYVHPDSLLMKHALERGAALRSFTGAAFLRLNDLPLALDRMVNTLQNRLKASPFGSESILLRVTSETESAEVVIGEGEDKGTPRLVELTAPATDLVRLFSGWFGISQLPVEGYSLRYRELLSILFPKGDPKMGIADMI